MGLIIFLVVGLIIIRVLFSDSSNDIDKIKSAIKDADIEDLQTVKSIIDNEIELRKQEINKL